MAAAADVQVAWGLGAAAAKSGIDIFIPILRHLGSPEVASGTQPSDRPPPQPCAGVPGPPSTAAAALGSPEPLRASSSAVQPSSGKHARS